MESKPCWVVYKNDQRIGQAITWHGALDIAIKHSGLNYIGLNCMKQYYSFVDVDNNDSYKIVRER